MENIGTGGLEFESSNSGGCLLQAEYLLLTATQWNAAIFSNDLTIKIPIYSDSPLADLFTSWWKDIEKSVARTPPTFPVWKIWQKGGVAW